MRVRSRERELREARGNADNQVAVDFPFASDWLREWRKFFLANHGAKCGKTDGIQKTVDT